ncbi:hypothetical protein AB1Y20_004247 [Prymnesium parvum]|uniref:Mediator of RNA polymerase II transcription subunit 21 n=1 Tax=Prymnesium parvum TaxID=97485 RepID=A0AB34J7M0_PRYPA
MWFAKGVLVLQLTCRKAREGMEGEGFAMEMAAAAEEVVALVHAAKAMFEELQESACATDAGVQQRLLSLSEPLSARMAAVTRAAALLDGEGERADEPAPERSVEEYRRERDELAEEAHVKNRELRTQIDLMRQLLSDMQLMRVPS